MGFPEVEVLEKPTHVDPDAYWRRSDSGPYAPIPADFAGKISSHVPSAVFAYYGPATGLDIADRRTGEPTAMAISVRWLFADRVCKMSIVTGGHMPEAATHETSIRRAIDARRFRA